MNFVPVVAICVATCQRPVGLARLLERLHALDVSGASVVLVVVDNDPSGSSEAVVDQARESLGWPVEWCVEPVRGIPYARNAALALASQHSPDWIVWIDDDEAPSSDWLQQVLAVQQAHDADVVLGPSAPIYEPGGSRLAIDVGGFEHERFPTGTEYPFFLTRTSGVLVRASAMPPEGFDQRLALTGGSDRLYFTLMNRRGARFVWADEAVVDEWIPASRQSMQWLLRRWFRVGVNRSLVLLIVDAPSWPRRLRRVGGGLWMATRGVGRMVMALPGGRVGLLRASRLVALGVGASCGALGLNYREYRTIHGS